MQQLIYETEKRTRRDKGMIIIDILRVLSEKERKFTHLLYKSNLSYHRLKHYLGELTDKDLVEVHENSRGTLIYSLSDKGLQTYLQYSGFNEFLHKLEGTA